MLNFDADTHTYTTEEGLLVPGVTDILGDLNIKKMGVYPPGSAERGIRIHSLLEYADKGTLDWATVDGAEDFRLLEVWAEAKEELGIQEWEGIEEIIFCKELWYAGTLDRRTKDMVVDIKSGQPHDWHALQVAAYARAAGASYGAVVYTKTGTVKLWEPEEMGGLMDDWASVRRAWRWVKK